MRLLSSTIRPAGRIIRFHFDGAEIEGLDGETIAASLSAAGIVAFRKTPSGAPRGLYCGIGACFDCVVAVDGRIGQRACITKVADGMVVAGAMPETLAPLTPDPTTPLPREQICDVLVVGAGPAGLSAALAAAEAGAEVIVLDERDAVGGQYH
ncbi:MAG: (2Fe-2S)-binding protein, partial [Acetobacteraceae bacterium]|nr:(2Fe-2S)-binding protein [Acetobacteraceae bacterium]